MLAVNKYKEILEKEFYLDNDDMTIRRATEGYRGRWKQHDIVSGYSLCSHGYQGIHIPRTRQTVNRSHLITMLRGITIPEGAVIDHIDGDNSNDVRTNLRVTTQSMNCKNSKARPNYSTKHNGITRNKYGKFIVRLYLNGIRKYLGCRNSLEMAIALRDSYSSQREAEGYTLRHGK